VPKELSDVNPKEFSTPMIYRLSSIPLIDPNTQELSEAYHHATFAEDLVGSVSLSIDA
jgi:hypothetical protein